MQQFRGKYATSESDLQRFQQGLKDQKVLILDLDETLIHCTEKPNENSVIVKMPSKGGEATFYIKKRPGLEKFLSQMSKHYVLILFSVATKTYISSILKVLNIEDHFSLILDRTFCKSSGINTYSKDISILGLSPKSVIFIDDSIENAKMQPQNTLIIQQFIGDENDRELSIISKYLIRTAETEDLRTVVESLSLYLQNNKPKQGVQTIKSYHPKEMLVSKLDPPKKISIANLTTESSFGTVDEDEFDQNSPILTAFFVLDSKREVSSEEISVDEKPHSNSAKRDGNARVQMLPHMNPKSQCKYF